MSRGLASLLIALAPLGCDASPAAFDQAGRIGHGAEGAQSAPAFVSLREQSAQLPMLRRVVAVELRGVSLHTALERVSESGGLRLTYSTDIIPRGRVVTLSSGRITVADALLAVLGDSGLDVLVSTEGDAVVVRCATAACR